MVIDLADALGEGRSGQADDHHIFMPLDELHSLLPHRVALINDEKFESRE